MLHFQISVGLCLCVCFHVVSSLSSIKNRRRIFEGVRPLHLVPTFHSNLISTVHDNLRLDEAEAASGRDLLAGVRAFLIAPAHAEENVSVSPTNTEIKLLRTALDVVYGDKNPAKALPLLSNVISAWENKAPDERAALYRVRGDCLLVRANVRWMQLSYLAW